MSSMTLGVLRKDISFIEEGIKLQNISKKNQASMTQETQECQSTKQKKLRYFLRKNRQITFKQCPARFKKAKANQTKLDTSGADKQPFVSWTVEVIIKTLKQDKRQMGVVMHSVNENRSVESVVSQSNLKKVFFSEEFNQFITGPQGCKVDTAPVSIKQVVQGEEVGQAPEEGEILDAKEELKKEQGEVVIREIDKKQTLKECLKGSVVFEFPTLYLTI